jgi:AmmeMemoRadiSam system protein B
MLEWIMLLRIRKRSLPVGWYPQDGEEVRRFLDKIPQGAHPRSALASVAPHAGWFYSGKIAARSVMSLDPSADTVVIIGGHLPAGMSPLFIEEAGVASPLGTLEIDSEFRGLLRKEFTDSIFSQGTAADCYQDNTIEVLLPLVAYFFPQARLLLFRLPEEMASFEAGKRIAQIGTSLGRKVVVLGSTDLTHYGRNYNFAPQGRGKQALDWVREVNDHTFIQTVIEGFPETVLERAEQDRSACSVGAVLGVLGFAQAQNADRGELLVYGTSADVNSEAQEIPESFVGYVALAWYR